MHLILKEIHVRAFGRRGEKSCPLKKFVLVNLFVRKEPPKCRDQSSDFSHF